MTPAVDLIGRPVLIVGLPRSGTSLVAGSLMLCGLWLGRIVGGNAYNPKGYFENATIREGIVKPILQRLGADPLGVKALPRPDALFDVPQLKASVAEVLRSQGYGSQQRWGYKGNKLALIWRLWDRHFPEADWILVERPAEEIVASCLRTPFMAHHSSDPAFWHDFVLRRNARINEIKQSHVRWQTIDASALAAGDVEQLRSMVDRLGLAWSDAVRDFIDPGLWRRWQSTGAAPTSPHSEGRTVARPAPIR
jgi:hypothetical protein